MASEEHPDALYAFDITLHARAPELVLRPAAEAHADAWGTWPTLAVTHSQLTIPMAVGFEEVIERLGGLPRMYAEPDGSFVWTSPRGDRWWQVDGNLFDRDGRVLLADMKGSCPAAEFDRLLKSFGWPGQAVIVQLVRPAVFLDESTFRAHATARGNAGDGWTLRPG